MGTRKFTKQDYKDGLSCRGACSKQQFVALGVQWPLEAGWYDRLLGSEIPEAAIKKFHSLKDAHLKDKQRYKQWKEKPDSDWCGAMLPDGYDRYYDTTLAPWEGVSEWEEDVDDIGEVDDEYFELMKFI